MKKFTKDITSVLAALTAGAVAVPGSMMFQNSSAEADSGSPAETAPYVTKVALAPGSSGIDDTVIEYNENSDAEQEWHVVGDMAPQDECTDTDCFDIENTPTAGVPLVSDEWITDRPVETEMPPLAGEPLPSDEWITDEPDDIEMPPTAGMPLVSDEWIDEPDDIEMPPYEGGMTIDDRYIPDENGRELCMIKVSVSDINFKDFLITSYQMTLVSEGMTEEDADAKCMSVYDEYHSRGIITNAAIKSAYKDYLNNRLTEVAADAVKQLTGDSSRKFEISHDYPEVSSVKIKLRLSDEEFSEAESSHMVLNVQNTEEIMRYGGKLDDKKIVEAIRRGDSTIPVNVRVKYSFGFMSENEAAELFRNLSGISGPVTVQKGADSAYFTAEAVPGQIEMLTSHDIVESVGYSYMSADGERPPIAINPSTNSAEYTAPGDISPDGVIDVTDLSMLSLYLIGDSTFTESQIRAADVDGDSLVTLADLAKLRQFLSKVIDRL